MNNRLWIIAILFFILLVLSHLPFAGFIFYPLSLFKTYIHELCHTMVALLTGAKVHNLSVSFFQSGYMFGPKDAAGYTTYSGGWQFFIIQAGYVGTTIVGSILLLISLLESPKIAKKTIGIIVGLIIVCLILFVRDLSTLFISLFFIGIGYTLLKYASDSVCQIFLGLIAMQCCFDSIESIFDLWKCSSCNSDAAMMQRITFIPDFIWVAFWLMLSFIIFGLTLLVVFKYNKS